MLSHVFHTGHVSNTEIVGHTSKRCPTGSGENNNQGASTGDDGWGNDEPSKSGGWGADTQDTDAGGWGSGNQDKDNDYEAPTTGNDDVEPEVEANW